MNIRNTFSNSKYNPKVKSSKSGQKPIRRLQTELNEQSNLFKPSQHNRNANKLEKKQPHKNKYFQVYSKVQPKQSNTQRPFKVHTNRSFVLNKYIKTQADESVSFTNLGHLGHQRKISQINNSNIQLPSQKYEIDGVAGKGTFGTVYFGHIRGSGKRIAIKKVYQDKKYKNRELQILKTLKHPNLLEMKDYYLTQEGDKQYLNVVMDYFPQNLYQFIKKKAISPNLIKIFTYQILRGLMAMNSKNISHRDMKPHNVLVNSSTNKVVICDFGSAKQLIEGEPNLAYICSRCYRAPELIFGATNYNSQIDMWSAACILVEMINGEPPFLGDSQIDQLIQIIKIMGAPLKQELLEMNPEYDLNQFSKFPAVKKTDWKNVLKTKDPLLIDLVHKLMQYSPKRRLTAFQALTHQYFDELRNQDDYKELHFKVKSIPELFDFNEQELAKTKNANKLIPKWIDTNHTSKLSTQNFNIDQLTSANLNGSESKVARYTVGQKFGPHFISTTTNNTENAEILTSTMWNKKKFSSQIRKQF